MEVGVVEEEGLGLGLALGFLAMPVLGGGSRVGRLEIRMTGYVCAFSLHLLRALRTMNA